VLDALLQLGIPPGGPVHNLIRYWDAQEWLNWFTCYDWQNPPVRVRNGLRPVDQRFLASLDDAIKGEIMYALFPHRARTLEGLGQGIITYQPAGNPNQALIETTLAIVRQLGIRRAYRYGDYFTPGRGTLSRNTLGTTSQTSALRR